jgi:hypothetical protein
MSTCLVLLLVRVLPCVACGYAQATSGAAAGGYALGPALVPWNRCDRVDAPIRLTLDVKP